MSETSPASLLAELAALAPAERRRAVTGLLLRVWERPAVLLDEIPPARAVAAVAAVAAGLPGAAGRPWRDERLADAAVTGVTAELAGRALCALDVVVGRDRESVPVALHVTDTASAGRLLDELREILIDGMRAG